LGKIGDLEAEVAAILVENDIRAPPFSEAQVWSVLYLAYLYGGFFFHQIR